MSAIKQKLSGKERYGSISSKYVHIICLRAFSGIEMEDSLSPLIGVSVGLALTLLLIMGCVVVRLRQTGPTAHDRRLLTEKAALPQTEKLNREPPDEKDPDVIPAKFGNNLNIIFLCYFQVFKINIKLKLVL